MQNHLPHSHTPPCRFRQQIFVVLACVPLAALGSAQPAQAKPGAHKSTVKQPPAQAISSSVEGAFLFAGRKDWDNAAAHARLSGDPTLKKLIAWLAMLDADSRSGFTDIAAFIRANPAWPRQERLRLRAEQSLRYSDVADDALSAWFAENPPVSGIGKIKFAELLMRKGEGLETEKLRSLIRDGWRGGDFEENEERRLLSVYGDLLREQDHSARADRLLWEEKPKAAQRMMELLPEGRRALARARIALLEDAKDAPFQLSHVPQALMDDPGLTYARLQWRLKKGDDDGVRELLLAAPAPVPYPEKWWRMREQHIRQAIDDKHYALARKLLSNHSQSDGQEQAEATWLSGWLSVEFLNNPQDAYLQFYRMFDEVKYPVSKSRAAYWAARAAEKAGDAEAAQSWYATASAYPTTFYGQLAHLRTHAGQPLKLPADPAISAQEKERFASNDLVRAIRLAASAREFDIATSLLNHLIDNADTDAQVSLAAHLGSDIHSAVLGVRGAKRAMQRNILLFGTGYPRPRLEEGLAIEPALALAVTRQESEFDPRARSKSGAVGMMQLLPSTAREQAKKEGLPFSDARLREADYNIRLGSAYLERLVNAYDGSYVLAIAAYNAGPGNVRGWIRDFGTPGGEVNGAVNWIEQIPFAETRNYVQRVLENVQLYRRLEDSAAAPALAQDLTRGE